MKYVILFENKVVTPNVDKEQFPQAVEAPDDIVFGDLFENGEWVRCGERLPIDSTPEELSEFALLKKELEEQKAIINAMLGVVE